MSKIKVRGLGRSYTFLVNQVEFQCQVDWKEENDLAPVDILIRDLEDIIVQLRKSPQFKVEKPFTLPPTNPNEGSSSENKEI